MPELPEVEIIIRDLKKVLPGLKITGFWTDVKSFKKAEKEILNKKILSVRRMGKNILIELSQNTTLLIHQKMTGHLMYGKWEKAKEEKKEKWVSAISGPMRDDPQNRFIHLLINLSNGFQLALCDMRKFAKVKAVKTDELNKLKDVKIGPDPMDKNFSFEKFKEALKRKRGAIKKILMDQKIIAGIGNIYSDEILWLAGFHPLKKVESFSKEELKKLYLSIKPVLKRAIRARGSSYIDYRDAFGRKGNYQNIQYAYGREGERCLKEDGGVIKRIKIGGRSAHFCPIHQKM